MSLRSGPSGSLGQAFPGFCGHDRVGGRGSTSIRLGFLDLDRPITKDLYQTGKIQILTREAPEALEVIRHDTAHVLAQHSTNNAVASW